MKKIAKIARYGPEGCIERVDLTMGRRCGRSEELLRIFSGNTVEKEEKRTG